MKMGGERSERESGREDREQEG